MIGRRIETCDERVVMPARCRSAIQELREAGWAVAVVDPVTLAGHRNRTRVEQTMLDAGVQRSKELLNFCLSKWRLE